MADGIEWLVVAEMDEFVLTYHEPGYYLADMLSAYDRGGASVICTSARFWAARSGRDCPSASDPRQFSLHSLAWY